MMALVFPKGGEIMAISRFDDETTIRRLGSMMGFAPLGSDAIIVDGKLKAVKDLTAREVQEIYRIRKEALEAS